MIEVVGLEKSFYKREVLSNININITAPGIYVVCGESGSGKSTLINILGMLDNEFAGEYYFFNKRINNLSSKEKELIRFNQISYIFQTPKFLENESILTNIEIGIGKKGNRKEIVKQLKKINLNIALKKKVSLLSGGERKRLSILIALLKDTPLILADEVTVGLDEENKYHVLDLLKKKSRNKVIIMVTHDISALRKYTNNIYYIKDGELNISSEKGKCFEKEISKDNKLKNTFLLKHVFSQISNKAGRTFICSFSMVIALVCLGFCLLLTSSLSSSITSSLSNSINDHQIIMSKKDTDYTLNENIAISNNDFELIKSVYGSYFSYSGCKYLVDFNNLFKDQQYFSIEVNNRPYVLNKYGINEINNFTYFTEEKESFIYTYIYDLQEDEVIIGLTPNQVYTFCKALKLEYINEQSLMKYFKDNCLSLTINIENEDWEYEISVPLKVVGYYVSNIPCLFHTNSLWNEYIIEHVLQLPFNKNLNQIDNIPWMIKKIDYCSININKEFEFLNQFISNKDMDSFQYGIFKKDDIFNVYFLYSHQEYIFKNEIEKIQNENSFDTYIACSNNGYNVVKDALLSGFSMPTFISNEYKLLEEYIDYNTYSDSNLGMYQSTILNSTNDKLMTLNILDGNKENFLNIKTYTNENIALIGSYPKKYNEIIISTKLAKDLNIPINDGVFSEKPIYFMTLKDIEFANGKYKNNFIIEKLYISGIIESDEDCIYVPSYWPSLYLSIVCESGSKKYLTNNVIFEYSGENIEGKIKELNDKYNDYNFENPFLEYLDVVNDTIKYINLGLSIFSMFCLISSVLMMIISSYLFVVDSKKEIGIYTFYGYKRKSIEKQYKLIGTVLSLHSALLSVASLLMIMYMLNEGMLGIEVPFSLNSIVPFIVIIVVSVVIGDVASFISTRKTLKENPLKQLQEN